MEAWTEKEDNSYEWAEIGRGYVCGEDFCDNCGDCLDCYGSDWCPSGEHRWVIYKEDEENPLTNIKP